MWKVAGTALANGRPMARRRATPKSKSLSPAHRAGRLAVPATHTGLCDVPLWLMAQRHAKLTGRPRDGVDLGQRVHVHARLQRGAGQARRERAHRAVFGREGLGEASHVPPEARRALDQMHLDAGSGELLGGRHAGDPAADHERGAVQERARARQIGLTAGARDRGTHDAAGLLRARAGSSRWMN